ncbi:23S rRNA (pseudouridine(1915)-N(3))-methyltransferase RlmH [uncultured Victivallis sp.]|uniref:23S rRNA (pseudouridine(1915)-N(3))-methyltransferase RlmH n=1 Tax=uncultured Victivallis sp. TaxID=354118 RepID=UPI0025D3CBA8|nr:23S rRNA (pseudouridine(1915)-N(3))-methyltransferase RlmH [uncultured Victivallis sp.]
MLLKLVLIGKLKDRALQARCDEFAKWLSPYAKLEIVELPDSNVAKEGQAIVKALEKERSAAVVVLSEEGRQFTSTEFAAKLGSFDRKIVFVIGGPCGLAPEVKQRADLLWSLSKLTFTHELARLLLMEQLFRATNILHGGSYHNP